MIQIDKLPSLVLEKVFSFVPTKLELRLVCKRFKDTVDNSSQLLEKYYLNVSKIAASHSGTELRIRSLKFEHLGYQEFAWIQDYDQKDRISSMRFAVGYRVIENSAEFLQYILLNFKFGQEFYLLIYDEVLSFWNPVYYLKNMYSNWFPGPREKLYDVESSKLQHITICSRHSINDVLSIFSDISSIKNLEICNHSPPLRFPDQVSWSLEILQFNHFQLDEDECQRILESQKPTLKIIDLYSESMCNYVMRNHPDVESLSLCRGDEAVGNFLSIQPDHLGLIINRIIAKAPELRILGILESTLKHQKMTYEELLSQMDNKGIVLKVYDNYKKMTNEYWESKYFGSDEAEDEND